MVSHGDAYAIITILEGALPAPTTVEIPVSTTLIGLSCAQPELAMIDVGLSLAQLDPLMTVITLL